MKVPGQGSKRLAAHRQVSEAQGIGGRDGREEGDGHVLRMARAELAKQVHRPPDGYGNLIGIR